MTDFVFIFWKGVYSKKKEFATNGSKFCLFRVDPFSEGPQKGSILGGESLLPDVHSFLLK